MGRSVRRGRAILLATRDSLPEHVGNDLRCVSCHLDEGRRASSIPWTGVYARFPQYRSRSGRVIRLEDRVNDCLKRSLNGSPLPYESDAMRDIVAYMAYLSRGTAVGSEGGGLERLEPMPGDTVRGRAVFVARCARCHGADGQGTTVAPPLWGPRSYNIGAGMARLRTAAAFIKHNMPYDAPTLTAQEAFDVAAYVVSRPRPDYPGKELDWPNGDPPPDVAYPTRAAGRRQP
ncbi:MAG TPA: c-type cytochrome [Gemmatimonadaceae bacterium]|nr:c-type cytochrome [Gemmatimonadaceae bacterium]